MPIICHGCNHLKINISWKLLLYIYSTQPTPHNWEAPEDPLLLHGIHSQLWRLDGYFPSAFTLIITIEFQMQEKQSHHNMLPVQIETNAIRRNLRWYIIGAYKWRNNIQFSLRFVRQDAFHQKLQQMNI